jgi:hypothetical protein
MSLNCIHMKKKSAILIATLLLLGTLIRFAQVALNSSGGGRMAASPDSKFLALASDFHQKRFWGGTHNYYEFTVKTAGGGRVHHIVMDEPPQGMIDWREDGGIQWVSDSSCVTYTFKGGQLTLNVVQQDAPRN